MSRARHIGIACCVAASLAFPAGPLWADEADDGMDPQPTRDVGAAVGQVSELQGDLCDELPPLPMPAVTPRCEGDDRYIIPRCTYTDNGGFLVFKEGSLASLLDPVGITIEQFREANGLGPRYCRNSPLPPVGTRAIWRIAPIRDETLRVEPDG
ncbi:hypothetical protein [Rhodosalinus halophilus]|uniref:hypothetical protein n=1 Tax=Rhodosalinus halophilus TaxID=2259333 RepID=UPI0011BD8513|nr:hypothetical protein [Rhodosalinus halophilus]